MPMFSKQIRFVGKHAAILQKYSKDKGGDQDIPFKVSNNDGSEKIIYLFDTKIQCYMVAAMLGIIKRRTAEIDKNLPNANIFVDVLNKNRASLERIYHHMVLGDNNEESTDSKIKKAFSLIADEKCDEEQKKLEDFVRGGLEILDEIFGECKTYEDVCNSMYDLGEILDLDAEL